MGVFRPKVRECGAKQKKEKRASRRERTESKEKTESRAKRKEKTEHKRAEQSRQSRELS